LHSIKMKMGETTVSLVFTVRRGGCCSRNRETSRKDIPQIFSLSPKEPFSDTGFVGLNPDTFTENGQEPYSRPSFSQIFKWFFSWKRKIFAPC
jgi:hypothetical protein